MDSISIIQKEHDKILDCLMIIEKLMNEEVYDYRDIHSILQSFGDLWDKHEMKEEKLFKSLRENGSVAPVNKMLLEQHRELRGHWEIINDAISTKKELNLKVALDTDGRMLIEKLRKHIKAEDKFFEDLSLMGIITSKRANLNI